ncbi:hypothetical protein NDU88_005686 [Pleurodeles waltl]|uniref:Uncharacterized protein n=1 Tax=Pleurodeles waltl TaxID=8319 RepID=A0AAV7TCP0_PLEWA|nr:hypothetical protein NDU88_005686 [Pleurodeles waltl]
MVEKPSRTEELLEALMLRMDAMDQAIASLKAQTSSSGVVASSKEDVHQRVGTPSSKAVPPAPKRARGQRKEIKNIHWKKKKILYGLGSFIAWTILWSALVFCLPGRMYFSSLAMIGRGVAPGTGRGARDW